MALSLGTSSNDEDCTNFQEASLEALLARHPLSADLQISAFFAAVQHYRRASVATPFPSEHFTTGSGEKDFDRCLQALNNLGPVSQMVAGGLPGLPEPTYKLLEWLVAPRTRRRSLFKPISMHEFALHLHKVQPGITLPAFPGHASPSAIFKNVTPASERASFQQPVVAYHGTCMENVHSIMNTGLLNFSGTRMQRTGAIFGSGIYTSTEYNEAFTYSQPGLTWHHSALGYKTRCMLVCEVDLSKVEPASAGNRVKEVQQQAAAAMASQQAGATGSSADTSATSHSTAAESSKAGTAGGMAGAARAASPSNAPGNGGKSVAESALPDTFLLVKRPDAIRLLYVLIYCDERAPQRAASRRVNWCTLLVVVYALGMVLQWLVSDPYVRRVLRQYWWQWTGHGHRLASHWQ